MQPFPETHCFSKYHSMTDSCQHPLMPNNTSNNTYLLYPLVHCNQCPQSQFDFLSNLSPNRHHDKPDKPSVQINQSYLFCRLHLHRLDNPSFEMMSHHCNELLQYGAVHFHYFLNQSGFFSSLPGFRHIPHFPNCHRYKMYYIQSFQLFSEY